MTENTQAGFDWIPFYEEFANELLAWRDRQGELITFLEELRVSGLTVTPLMDKDEHGISSLLTEIDPFTFFGSFNRGTVQETRTKILQEIKTRFGVAADTPQHFAGIPILNNQNSWFFASQSKRKPDDISRLWDIFAEALKPDPLKSPAFAAAFDKALEVRNTNINLTIGLFWIRPRIFLNLDGTMRGYKKIKLPPKGLSTSYYLDTLEDVKKDHPDFAVLSHQAYIAPKEPASPPPPGGAPPPLDISAGDVDFWMVGAYWEGDAPADQTARFLAEGVWENGYDHKFLEDVKAMKVGDKIAIKAAKTQKLGLPFNSGGRTVSMMTIKAVGTVVKNRGDGKTVEVEWEPAVAGPRDWYFYTNRYTVWRLKKGDGYAKRLIQFVFNEVPQDYDFFVDKWYGKPTEVVPVIAEIGGDARPYTVLDLLDEGVFLTEDEINLALRRLKAKKNLILQGAPGVGKTFVARRLAYALMESADDTRVKVVQFHPSYSYEDFIRGFRPTDEAGKFELVDGSFWLHCDVAAKDPDRKYVLIIDEINRGNLSQVFGELFMLLEADKRGKKHEVTPLYRRTQDELFYIPENVFVIGTMNIADRSLALVDYALRRRFSFLTLLPKFGSEAFRKWLKEHGLPEKLSQTVSTRMQALNSHISDDSHLGAAFQIGHSFFCPKEKDDFSGHGIEWFQEVVETEILPLLDEYWYDAPEKVKAAKEDLLG